MNAAAPTAEQQEVDFELGPLDVSVYEHTYSPNPVISEAKGDFFIAVDADVNADDTVVTANKTNAAKLRTEIEAAVKTIPGLQLGSLFHDDFHHHRYVLPYTLEAGTSTTREDILAVIQPVVDQFRQMYYGHSTAIAAAPAGGWVKGKV